MTQNLAPTADVRETSDAEEVEALEGRWHRPEPRTALAVVSNLTPLLPAQTVEPRFNARPTTATRDLAGACVLAAGWHFEGKLEPGGDVRLDGEFAGTVTLPGPAATLTVSAQGRLQGAVTGGGVKIDGTFDGEIDAAGARVELASSGTSRGSIKYTQLQIDGGRHNVTLEHVDAQ